MLTMLPGQVPDVLTPCTVFELRAALERAWIAKFDASPRLESLLVLLAQTVEETGWMKSCHAWNFGNAKHVDGDGRAWCAFRCNEIIGGKEVWFDPPHPATRFRAFATIDEGAADYLELLWHRFGRSWGAVLGGDPAAFARALKAQGYYTASEALYEAALVALYRQIEKMLAAPAALDVSTPRGLQAALNAAGALPRLSIDGDIREKTRAAIRAFQVMHRLAPTGYADEATLAALRAALAALAALPK